MVFIIAFIIDQSLKVGLALSSFPARRGIEIFAIQAGGFILGWKLSAHLRNRFQFFQTWAPLLIGLLAYTAVGKFF
ncbi:MAG: hypothetical protein ABEK12_04135, partial [Candidatus Nanohaloarchaea archaeon]